MNKEIFKWIKKSIGPKKDKWITILQNKSRFDLVDNIFFLKKKIQLTEKKEIDYKDYNVKVDAIEQILDFPDIFSNILAVYVWHDSFIHET